MGVELADEGIIMPPRFHSLFSFICRCFRRFISAAALYFAAEAQHALMATAHALSHFFSLHFHNTTR